MRHLVINSIFSLILPEKNARYLIFSEEDIQLGRLMERNKLSESDAKKRIQAQMSLDKKCERSHFVIDNSGSLTDTKSQTILIMNMLMESKHHWKMRSVFMATAALLLSGLAWFINRKYKYVGN